MNLFFDTNVWLSAFLTTGVCRDLINECLLNHTIQTSERVLLELHRQLNKKYKKLQLPVESILQFIREEAVMVQEIPIKPICRDSDDNHILAAALGGASDYLVTGDRDLLVLKVFFDIPILTPSEFLRLFGS